MIQPFLQYLITEKRVSEHTIKAYEKDVTMFFDFVQINNLEEIKEITYQNIRGWIVELVSQNNSRRTVNRKISSLRTFFRWAEIFQLIEINPCAKIKGLKQEKRIPEYVREDDISREKMGEVFPDNLSGQRDRLLIEVLYQTGMRLSELIGIQLKDVNKYNIKVLGKRNKERYIPISKELYADIEMFLQTRDKTSSPTNYLFTTDKGKQLYPKFVYRKVKHYLSLLTNLKKKSPHVLRHTFATHMLNNGTGLETLKEILGHADLSATQIYTHSSFEQLSNIYKNSHPRGKNSKNK